MILDHRKNQGTSQFSQHGFAQTELTTSNSLNYKYENYLKDHTKVFRYQLRHTQWHDLYQNVAVTKVISHHRNAESNKKAVPED